MVPDLDWGSAEIKLYLSVSNWVWQMDRPGEEFFRSVKSNQQKIQDSLQMDFKMESSVLYFLVGRDSWSISSNENISGDDDDISGDGDPHDLDRLPTES